MKALIQTKKHLDPSKQGRQSKREDRAEARAQAGYGKCNHHGHPGRSAKRVTWTERPAFV